MVPITSLLLPVLLSAVFVFAASFVIYVLLPYHRTDLQRLPDEESVMSALRPLAIPPGEYMVPHAEGPSEMGDPAFAKRMAEGPVAIMTVFPLGIPSMGRQLTLWFAYCLIVGILTAYVTGRAVAAGAGGAEVFRFAGAVSFIAYTVAHWQSSIWYRRAWGTNVKHTFDGLVYSLLTAGAFTWLWPA
jgi:hypothetical protein